jgi:hypothetical protein
VGCGVYVGDVDDVDDVDIEQVLKTDLIYRENEQTGAVNLYLRSSSASPSIAFDKSDRQLTSSCNCIAKQRAVTRFGAIAQSMVG